MAEPQGLYPLYTTQFTTAFELKLQQMGSKLSAHVSEGFHVGKQASPINQIGAIQSRAPAGRYAPMNRVDADFTRRWVFPLDREIPQLIDSFDELKTIADPKSFYVQNASNAAGRDWDDEILTAATRDASLGQDAGSLTTETFDTSLFRIASTFGSSAATGLTVAKLIEARRIFRKYHNDIDNDPMVVVIGSQQEADLLKQSQVVSLDYTDRPVLTDGKLSRLLGFNIVVMERVPQTTASSVRGCLAWVKSGLHLGKWLETTNRVSIRNDLSSEPYQLYTKYSYGATRTQPGKVIQILCADTTGADITP